MVKNCIIGPNFHFKFQYESQPGLAVLMQGIFVAVASILKKI